ncbi:MAG: hypothetical protein ACRDCW_17955 [Sarcina sp.]
MKVTEEIKDLAHGLEDVVPLKADNINKELADRSENGEKNGVTREILDGIEDVMPLRVDNLDEGHKNIAKDITNN